MTRDERRQARLEVIAAEREKRHLGHAKRAARLLGLSVAQVKHLTYWWTRAAKERRKCQQ